MVNENTQPGNVCRFANSYDSHSNAMSTSVLDKQNFQEKYKKYNLLQKNLHYENQDSSNNVNIQDFNHTIQMFLQ